MHGGVNRTHKTTTSRVPYDVGTYYHVFMPKILKNPRFERELRILFACFPRENMQLVKFFANFEKKIKQKTEKSKIPSLQIILSLTQAE